MEDNQHLRAEFVGPGNDNDYLYVLRPDGRGFKFPPSMWQAAERTYRNAKDRAPETDDVWLPSWLCQHRHLNMDGICYRCGADCRGAH